MTSRLRPTTRRRPRLSMGGEDRQAFVITAAFAGVIILLLAILGGVAAWDYYLANIRPLAGVGSVELRPDMVRQYALLQAERLERESRWVLDARNRGEIDSTRAQALMTRLDQQRDELQYTTLEDLIDRIYQAQLAADMGIAVTDQEVDERLASDTAGEELRHVQVLTIEAEVSEGATAATFGQQEEARQRAEEAHAELLAGRPWEEVFAEYNDDDELPADGDLGLISRSRLLESALRDRLFELGEGEVTEVIRGTDGPYRIGRVLDIQTAPQDVEFQESILERMPLDRYRQFLAWELASDRLRRQVMTDALTGEHEQVQLSHIRIDNVSPDDDVEGDDEDQVHYSEILYAPGDDQVAAPDLDEDDPQWEEARQAAAAALAELLAIEDGTDRLERFREIAREDSDDEESGAQGGDAGSVTRDMPPSEVADVLFDEEHGEESLVEEAVRAENGYYVIWFHERRDPPAQRLASLVEALDGPDVDWPALVLEYSDDQLSREEGGVIGWWTRDMLEGLQDELGETIFGLAVGEIADPVALGTNTHVFRVEQRASRTIDADMARFIRGQPEFGNSYFDTWYAERKDKAEEDDVIRRVTDEGEDAPDDLGDFGDPGEEAP